MRQNRLKKAIALLDAQPSDEVKHAYYVWGFIERQYNRIADAMKRKPRTDADVPDFAENVLFFLGSFPDKIKELQKTLEKLK